RVPVEAGQGPGRTNRPLGAAFGAEAVTLTVPQMPAHDHPPATSLEVGTAPSPYPTLLANNRARHVIRGPRLGNTEVAEADGQPSPTAADPDGDNDGVTFLSPFVAGGTAAVRVNVQNAPTGAKLDAWIDWNHNGSWNDPGEQVAASLAVVN